MCKIIVDKTLNPNFILYNLVFGSNSLQYIDVNSLNAYMQKYGIDIDCSQIQNCLNS